MPLVTSDGELQQLIESKRNDHIFLTVLGFGTGNVKDSKMELLADKGNGNYAYVDSLAEDADLYAAGLTSHATVNLMIALEDHFGVEFPERMLRRRAARTRRRPRRHRPTRAARATARHPRRNHRAPRPCGRLRRNGSHFRTSFGCGGERSVRRCPPGYAHAEHER